MASMQAPKSDARILNVPVTSAKPPAPNQTGQHASAKSAPNSSNSSQNPPNPATAVAPADATTGEVAQKVLKSTQIVSHNPDPSAGGQGDDREVAQKVLKSTQIVSPPPENPKSASHALEIHTPQPVPGPHSTAQSTALAERPDLGQRRSSMLQRMDESQYFRGEQLFVYCLATGVHVIEAARVSGLSRATAYRRCHDKKLRKHVKELRSQIESRKVGMLMDSTADAIRTLRELLEDDSPKVRLAAANCLLRHASVSADENSDPVFSDRGINMMQFDPISEEEIKFMGEDSK